MAATAVGSVAPATTALALLASAAACSMLTVATSSPITSTNSSTAPAWSLILRLLVLQRAAADRALGRLALEVEVAELGAIVVVGEALRAPRPAERRAARA